MRNERFELLFDFGAAAFLDGYYREAVANFATAFERFLEFFVRVTWASQGTAGADVDAVWKQVAKQSERQLGAFLATYLLVHRVAPEMPSQKDSEFRNDVVHRGLIPERQRTAEYATKMYSVMTRHLITLCAAAHKSVVEQVEKPSVTMGQWAEAQGCKPGVYCFDGMFGIYRYLPTALANEKDSVQHTPDPKVAAWLRTDLEFLEALDAREMFVRHRFVRPVQGS